MADLLISLGLKLTIFVSIPIVVIAILINIKTHDERVPGVSKKDTTTLDMIKCHEERKRNSWKNT